MPAVSWWTIWWVGLSLQASADGTKQPVYLFAFAPGWFLRSWLAEPLRKTGKSHSPTSRHDQVSAPSRPSHLLRRTTAMKGTLDIGHDRSESLVTMAGITTIKLVKSFG